MITIMTPMFKTLTDESTTVLSCPHVGTQVIKLLEKRY